MKRPKDAGVFADCVNAIKELDGAGLTITSPRDDAGVRIFPNFSLLLWQ